MDSPHRLGWSQAHPRIARPSTMLLAVLLAACSSGGSSNTTPSTHAISGTVSGAASAGVTVALSGAASATTATGAGGTYSFTGLADGSYTVVPSLAGFRFTPASRSVTLSGADSPGQDFQATSLAIPAAPAAVSVRPADGGAIVSWTPSAGATSYTVYSGTTPALTTASASVSASGTSATVTGLPNGQRRFFAVSAVGTGGEGPLTPARCGVPTASSTRYGGGALDPYDGLCEDRLDGSRWYQPGAWSAGVSGGAAVLSVDGDHLEPRILRNQYLNAGAAVNAGGARVSTLSAQIEVPQAATQVTGGGRARASVRIAYSPPSKRLAYPAPNQDFLLVEAGLMEAGAGLRAFRNVYHCDDARCVTLGTTGVAISDPAGFTAAANLASAPASYDTPYRVTVSLDETSGVFHWSIQGGTEFATAASGSANPAAYLAATSSWSGISLAGAGFTAAQLGVRGLDDSTTGGGSARMTGVFDDVQVGLDGASATLWDDFSGTGSNSGPTELSLAKWNGIGNQRVLPTGDGALGMHLEVTSTGVATVVPQALALASPEGIDVLQADFSIPSFDGTGAGTVTGVARLDGRFHNDGSGTTAGSALGDVSAAVYVSVNGSTRTATWFVFKCLTANCSGAVGSPASGDIPAPSLAGTLALRVGYDRGADEFVFGVGTTYVNVPAPAGTTYVAPARAPVKRVWNFVSLPSQAGTRGALDVRVNDVFTGSLGGAPAGLFCNALDPSSTAAVNWVALATAPPAPGGGTVLDGTYALTATNVYTGTGGATGTLGSWRQLWTFSGSSAAVVLRYADGTTERHTGTYGVSGTTLTFIESCPSDGTVKQFEYTATTTSLTVQDAGGPGGPGTTAEYVLSRR